MKEIHGDMFAYLGRDKFRLCITTNGFVKNDGTAVMGRGNARKAVQVFQEEYNVNLPETLGKALQRDGNVMHRLTTQLYTFPVKEHWADKAKIKLIRKSAQALNELAKAHLDKIFILPRPGCGNGGLKWEKVRQEVKFLPDNVWVIASWEDPQWQNSQRHIEPIQKIRSSMSSKFYREMK